MSGHTVNELATVADKVVVEARKQPEITAVNNTMRTSIPLLQLDVDREKAALRGVAVDDVFKQLSGDVKRPRGGRLQRTSTERGT